MMSIIYNHYVIFHPHTHSCSPVHSYTPVSSLHRSIVGFEPWRFSELLPSASVNLPDRPGFLDWDTRQISDIRAGPKSSNPLFFTYYKGMSLFCLLIFLYFLLFLCSFLIYVWCFIEIILVPLFFLYLFSRRIHVLPSGRWGQRTGDVEGQRRWKYYLFFIFILLYFTYFYTFIFLYCWRFVESDEYCDISDEMRWDVTEVTDVMWYDMLRCDMTCDQKKDSDVLSNMTGDDRIWYDKI